MLSTAGVLFWGRTLESQSFDLVLAFKLLLPENARKLLVLTNIDIQSFFSTTSVLSPRSEAYFKNFLIVKKYIREYYACFDIVGLLRVRYVNKMLLLIICTEIQNLSITSQKLQPWKLWTLVKSKVVTLWRTIHFIFDCLFACVCIEMVSNRLEFRNIYFQLKLLVKFVFSRMHKFSFFHQSLSRQLLLTWYLSKVLSEKMFVVLSAKGLLQDEICQSMVQNLIFFGAQARVSSKNTDKDNASTAQPQLFYLQHRFQVTIHLFIQAQLRFAASGVPQCATRLWIPRKWNLFFFFLLACSLPSRFIWNKSEIQPTKLLQIC